MAIRVSTAYALGAIGPADVVDPEHVDEVVGALAGMLVIENEEPEVLLAAVASLGYVASPDAVRALTEALDHPYLEVREAAAEALASVRG